MRLWGTGFEMKTVDKAMSLLSQFSMENNEFGLSELARAADLDKAATRRLLVALSKHSFIEQISDTRKYRLGPGFLALARIREVSVPVAKAAQETVDWLSAEVGETSHIAVPELSSMVTLAFRMPSRGNIINILASQKLPYHATASGFAFMAFASDETRKRILGLKREKLTDDTLVTKDEISERIEETRTNGFSFCRNMLEDGVASIAMPYLLEGGDPVGTVAIAVPDASMDSARRTSLITPLREAVGRLERSLTGLPSSSS